MPKPTATISEINDLKSRLQRARREFHSAQGQVEQATTAVAEAEVELKELGFDPKKPLAPQVERLAKQAASDLAEIEEGLEDARRVLEPED